MRLKISLIIFIVTFFFFRTSALLQAGVIPGGWEKVDSQPQGAQIEESETPNRLLFRNFSQPGRQEITARHPISARVATLGKTGRSESRMFTGINDILPDWDHLFLIRDRLWKKDADKPSAGDKYQKIPVRLLLRADQLEIRDALTEEPLKTDLVKPSWDEVNQAQQQRDRLINEAWGEGNRVIPRAEGEAQHTISRAQKYALDRVNRAQGDATAQAIRFAP